MCLRVSMSKQENTRLGNSTESWFCEPCAFPQSSDSQSEQSDIYAVSSLSGAGDQPSLSDLTSDDNNSSSNNDPFAKIRQVPSKHFSVIP